MDQLLSLLRDHELVSETDLARVESYCAETGSAPGQALAAMRLLSERKLYEVIQRDLGMNSSQEIAYRNYSICGLTVPRHKVSGDFFGYFALEEGRIAITLSDVSGKGLEAGLLALLLGNLLRQSVRMRNVIPSVVLRKINQASAAFFGIEQFATFTVFILDMDSGTVEFSSAGTPPLLVYRQKEKAIEELDMRNIPVGIDENFLFTGRKIHIDKGDLILLFTDGAYEAQNLQGDFYGLARLKESMLFKHDKSAKKVINHLKRKLKWFTLFRGLNDDTTYIAIRRG